MGIEMQCNLEQWQEVASAWRYVRLSFSEEEASFPPLFRRQSRSYEDRSHHQHLAGFSSLQTPHFLKGFPDISGNCTREQISFFSALVDIALLVRTYSTNTRGEIKTFPFLCILTRNSPSPTINIPRAVLLLTACKFNKLGLLTASSSSSSVGMH